MIENHRTRVAAEKRERTRAKLLKSALTVFAEKGPESPVIDDVIRLAGMSRGSFYNYFNTNEELLAAVALEISNELLLMVDPEVLRQADPAVRIACGFRHCLHIIQRHPLLGAFVSRMRWPTADNHLLGLSFLARDLALGIEVGRFEGISIGAAMDMVIGTAFCAANSVVCGTQAANYPEELTAMILRGLSIDRREAAQITAMPLNEVVSREESILISTLKQHQDGESA